MAKMFKEYPRMIYHESGEHRSVTSREELLEWIDKGWSISPVQISETKDLKAKIEKAKEDLRLMEMRLAAIEAVDEPEADLSSLAGLLSSAVAARPSAQSSPAEKGKPNKRAKKPKGK